MLAFPFGPWESWGLNDGTFLSMSHFPPQALLTALGVYPFPSILHHAPTSLPSSPAKLRESTWCFNAFVDTTPLIYWELKCNPCGCWTTSPAIFNITFLTPFLSTYDHEHLYLLSPKAFWGRTCMSDFSAPQAQGTWCVISIHSTYFFPEVCKE